MLLRCAKAACKEVSQVADDQKSKSAEDLLMRKCKAAVFVIASLMVIFTPWIMLGVQFYCVAFLGKNFPMFEQTMYFCGVCIMGLLGISPYVLDFLKGKNDTQRKK